MKALLQDLAVSTFCRLPHFRGKERAFRKLFGKWNFDSARSSYKVRLTTKMDDVTYWFCMAGAYGHYIEHRIRGRKDRFVFLDIGANQGLFSLIAARNPSCVRVISIEPNPDTFEYLLRNIEVNGAAKVMPVRAAVASPGTGPLKLFVAEGHSGSASIYGKGKSFEAWPFKPAEIEAELDRHEGCAVVCKIDVEGAEAQVLHTLKAEKLLDRIDELILEISDTSGGGGHLSDLKGFLRDDGWIEQSRSGSGAHYDATFHRG